VPDETKVLLISVAARMAGMHPQTLRQYDRLGLVCPERTPGGGRRYSIRDVAMLREIQRLSQDEGINLAGVKRIIALEQLASDLRHRLAELEEELSVMYQRITELESLSAFPRRDLLPASRTSTEVVIYRGRS
jgi:MerR family transcriptional regulator/heat shock protein HspR